MSKLTDSIESAINPTVNNIGYRVVEVALERQEDKKILTVTISRAEGIGLDDCERVSKAIDPIIDDLDPISDSYFLCVSSPGIDRPLKRDADFLEAMGKRVHAKLYAAVDGQKTFTGELAGYSPEEQKITIRTEDGKAHTFQMRDVASVKPTVD